ncbi:MAG TPA: AAA family ATPase [Polyangiaceae bacterium]|nr:AAA family ATPase [Polyangiaceae bacterium]
MISTFRIERFKRYLKKELPLRELTVLAGANSAGKSALLQCLLLFRQASVAGGRSDWVELNGPFGLSLGEARDVVHAEADLEREGVALAVIDAKGTRYGITFRAARDPRSRRLIIESQPGRFPQSLAGNQRSFVYLGADRLGPRDVFEAVSLDHDDLNVGPRGEAVAQVLSQLDSSVVREALVHPETEARGARQTLPAQAELWLSDIVAPMRLDARWIDGTNVITLRFRRPGFRSEWERPSNVGFGVSYALPIIVGGLSVGQGGMLLVENPEAHLHPRGQSNIGAFLARVAASGVQVVLETHSDHVLNGIRRAVAAECVLGPGQAVLHFFDAEGDGGEPTIERVEIRPDGELSARPERFFEHEPGGLGAPARAREGRS